MFGSQLAEVSETPNNIIALAPPPPDREDGWSWVLRHINTSFPPGSSTRHIYHSDWKTWQRFLNANGIASAGALTRDHVSQFVKWREQAQGIKRTTCIKQVHFMCTILNEAIKRGLVERNVASAMRLKSPPRREYMEITPAMEEDIRAAIAKEKRLKEFYRVSFEIAIRQGCRLAETRFHIPSRVNFEQNQIVFLTKGNRWLRTALHPKVKELLQGLNREWTYEHPMLPSTMSAAWVDFWGRHFRSQWPDLTFHSTRVTCVSRLARAGVHEAQAMKYIGHSSLEIHRIYQRIRVDDLNACVAAL